MATAIGRRRKAYWDVGRWLDYGARIHRAFNRVDHVARRLPPTAGWKTRDTDALLKIRHCLELALVGMERVILEHFGGRWEDVPGPVARFPQHWAEHPPIPGRPWTRRPGPTSREDWTAFGAMLREARDTVQGCFIEFRNECRGSDRGDHLAAMKRALAWIEKARCRLDDLVCRQHPDWPEATRVFYGPMRPEVR